MRQAGGHDARMVLSDKQGLPRDPNRLLKEVDAAIKIRDIETVQRWRERIELQWWESGIVVMLFISGLGFMITIFKLIPRQNAPLFWFVFFWFALFIITLICAVEFMLAKINALRHLQEYEGRAMEAMRQQVRQALAGQSGRPAEGGDAPGNGGD